MKVLIINGHPTMETSNANKAILEEVKRLLPEAEVSNLQTLYPNYQIDVTAEQAKLVKADVIVWQFPTNTVAHRTIRLPIFSTFTAKLPIIANCYSKSLSSLTE